MGKKVNAKLDDIFEERNSDSNNSLEKELFQQIKYLNKQEKKSLLKLLKEKNQKKKKQRSIISRIQILLL